MIEVPAAPEALYTLVADVSRWPLLFGPTVNVTVLDRSVGSGDTSSERFRIHAMVGDSLRSWTSVRHLDRARLAITFDQEHSAPPLRAIGGQWEFEARAAGTRVVLTHRFTPADDTPESARWIAAAIDANSANELAALKRVASARTPIDALFITCEDATTAPAGVDAFDFLLRAERWPDILPHVDSADLRELGDGAQDLRLVTRAPDGQIHHTRSIRLCSRPDAITYKQLAPPLGLMGHSGVWTLTACGDGRTAVTSRHDALLAPERLGSAGDAAAMARQMRSALSRASGATLSRLASAASPATLRR
jgi:ribosome-associated toxin RatA of RatAB toxin-antitoxin module